MDTKMEGEEKKPRKKRKAKKKKKRKAKKKKKIISKPKKFKKVGLKIGDIKEASYSRQLKKRLPQEMEWCAFKLDDEEQEATLDHYLKRYSKYKEELKNFFRLLINQGSINLGMLENFPVSIDSSRMTVFDQVYELCMAVAFPNYKPKIIDGLFGPDKKGKEDVKLWRCIFPPKFGIHQVLIRATSFQQAFALACDYACRLSVQMYHQIPKDLTVRVTRASHKLVKQMLLMRHANRKVKLKQRGFTGGIYTFKQFTATKLPALGHNKQPDYKIFYSIEWDHWEDLTLLRSPRASRVEIESFNKQLPDEYLEYRASLGQSDPPKATRPVHPDGVSGLDDSVTRPGTPEVLTPIDGISTTPPDSA